MRYGTLILIFATSVLTQSCRIEMPSSVVDSLGRVNSRIYSLYDFKASKAIALQGGFKDTLIIADIPGTWHADAMVNRMDDMGIPTDESTVLFRKFASFGSVATNNVHNLGLKMFASGEFETLRRATRVVHIPWLSPFAGTQDIPRIQAGNILFALAAGNVRERFEGDRDVYNAKHVKWNDPDDSVKDARRGLYYKNLLDAYSTGKVIAATSAEVTWDGTGGVEPRLDVVPCGDIKKACFTVAPGATSPASARLAAMSFYLSQFYETVEEVVETLNVCAVDIGEPGIDREFGRGMANLLCPRVLKKEVEIVSSYVEKGSVAETSQGGELQGFWEADKLQIYIPAALQQTLQVDYMGETTGTVEFTKEHVAADFRMEASVSTTFILPIEAKAEGVINARGTYTVTDNVLTLQGVKKPFAYTATEDSLHLIQPYTLNEALALLPDPFGSMVDMTSEDFFTEDPIQIKMSFAKKSKLVGDFNEDMVVDFVDFLLLRVAFGSFEGDPEFEGAIDLEPDGMINFTDFLLFAGNFGATGK